jgi:hypothetical protein
MMARENIDASSGIFGFDPENYRILAKEMEGGV